MSGSEGDYAAAQCANPEGVLSMSSLAHTIYERSLELSDESARQVLDFVDFLFARQLRSAVRERAAPPLPIEQDDQLRREAVERLRNVDLSWDGGKPIPDRNELYDTARGKNNR